MTEAARFDVIEIEKSNSQTWQEIVRQRNVLAEAIEIISTESILFGRSNIRHIYSVTS